MNRIIAALAVALFASAAHAQVACAKVGDAIAHVCWSAPTTNTDGTPISTPVTYDVEIQAGTAWNKAATALTATDWKSAVLAPGSYTYRVIAFAAGQASDPSNNGSKQATTPKPNPPGGVVIAQVTFTVPATCDITTEPAQCVAVLAAR